MSPKAQLLRAVLPMLAAIGFAGSLTGQAVQTADQRIRLKAYGMFSYVRPDFRNGTRNLGVTAGADLDGFRFLPHTDLGLDVRYTASAGSASNQYVFAGGPRISYNAYRFKPYGDFLLGAGRSTFPSSDPNYKSDSSGVLAYGGGFDYNLTQYWSLRADAQRQRWQFSKDLPYFYPLQASIGVAYQIHLSSRTGPRY